MRITHNSKTGKTVIQLSWTETRQFSSGVTKPVVDAVKDVVKATSSFKEVAKPT